MLLSAVAFLVLNHEGPTREPCVLCAQVPSVVPNSFATLWAVACQSPLSMRFSRQEYWNGLPFPSPGDLPNTGIKLASLVSPALAGVLYHWCHLGSHNSFGFHSLDCCLCPSFFLSFFLKFIYFWLC